MRITAQVLTGRQGSLLFYTTSFPEHSHLLCFPHLLRARVKNICLRTLLLIVKLLAFGAVVNWNHYIWKHVLREHCKHTMILINAQGCGYLNTIAGISNITSYECSHLQEGTLDKLISSIRLKPETKPLLLHHKYVSESSGNVLVSAWMPSSCQTRRHICLSVWVGVIHLFEDGGESYWYLINIVQRKDVFTSQWYLDEVVSSIFDNSFPFTVIEKMKNVVIIIIFVD